LNDAKFIVHILDKCTYMEARITYFYHPQRYVCCVWYGFATHTHTHKALKVFICQMVIPDRSLGQDDLTVRSPSDHTTVIDNYSITMPSQTLISRGWLLLWRFDFHVHTVFWLLYAVNCCGMYVEFVYE